MCHTVAGVKGASPALLHRLPFDSLSDASPILSVFAFARCLRAEARSGSIRHALQGKNLSLLVETPGPKSSPLQRAAIDLGARVAEVPFADADGSVPRDLGALARILGRMYDAIDCGSLAAPVVERIEREAGVPVYAGLGLDDRPARALADLLTLSEAGPPTGAPPGIVFLGDTQTLRSRVFLASARQVGFVVKPGKPGHESAASEADFVVDATHPPRWSLRRANVPLDEEQRSENHRCLMQTVLMDTMARA